MTARILSGSSAVTAPRRERPHLGASQGRGWGTGLTVCSSRQSMALAAPRDATQPVGRVYRLVSACGLQGADTRPDALTPWFTGTRPHTDMGLPAHTVSITSAPRLTASRLPVPLRVHPVMGLRAPFRVSADARSDDRARQLANTRPSLSMCLPACALQGAPFRVSASTRTLRVRVRPLNALAPTPASGPPFARNACIEDGLSAPKGCMQETLSAPAGCLSFPLIPVRACLQGPPAGVRSAPEGLLSSPERGMPYVPQRGIRVQATRASDPASPTREACIPSFSQHAQRACPKPTKETR
jgi:hypothetical protein